MFVETEKEYEIFYQNQRVGFYRTDIVVDDSVTVEVKCCKELAPEHSAQLINYRKASGRIAEYPSIRLDISGVSFGAGIGYCF